jgi:uncharacterized protein (DUF697 family)
MSDKEVLATEIVKRYSLYAGGAGLIPMPWVDFAAVAGIELKMLSEIAKVYDVPFEKDRVRPIVSAIIGGYATTSLGYGAGGSLLKSVPVIGSLLGVVAVPGFAAGLTWAIGKVFITHFASGGTFLDFDPDQVAAFYKGTAAKSPAA